MPPPSLNGKTIAVLATDGFEQVELTKPVEALRAAGATVEIVAPKSGAIQGFKHHDKADKTSVDKALLGRMGGTFRLDRSSPGARFVMTFQVLDSPAGEVRP